MIINEYFRSKATLGNLQIYVMNSKKFIKDDKYRQMILERLQPWRNDDRNGFLHKDTIHSYDDICRIRKSSLSLMLLLLNVYYLDKPEEQIEEDDLLDDDLPF